MSELVQLCTADGEEVYAITGSPLCQWSTACTAPAVQMRRLPGKDPVPVCERETEHAEWFRNATGQEFEVPGVGHVAVVFGADKAHPHPAFVSPDFAHRAYRVFIGGAIVAEGDNFTVDSTRAGDDVSLAIELCGWMSMFVEHAACPWAPTLYRWSQSQTL